MPITRVEKAEEYITMYGLHEALYNAVFDGEHIQVVHYIHEATGFDDDPLVDVAQDSGIGVDDIKRALLLK